ncbi:ABC transporter ATP-binding protein [Coraliomargarita akajimensis]|uniref:ABC transporter related protein n=1 Tax=Coraliomargarita akajimensis (strain DSM 45221 / IAM 15411 / JCM 23193 / KCTC 12865 / 04OKA010-24) TaxID=583355 RepID=D5ENN5_CORAD|nr:ATP-binding cassette domain-containing protein [Coraliomargarita akajimensis]ADE55511.1 ABC transporter related protein [Coraliomargarita akajimensis DSM 45221]
MTQPYLEIRGLRKAFGDKQVLDGVDLSVAQASITTVIGKSGIGKSVLLKCIARLLQADSGVMTLKGQPIGAAYTAEAGRSPFSYMFQNNALFDSMTAFENVALPLQDALGLQKTEVVERVDSILEQLELSDAAARYPAELSGGMQKRVALARALVTNPEVVLFDEPTTGLDPERKYSVFEMIADYRERFGFTALLVSHDIPEVFEISDRVAWLDSGRIRFFGDPRQLDLSGDEALSGFLRKANYGRKPVSEASIG